MRSHVAFGLVLAVQVVILATIPARHLAARSWGTEITLRTDENWTRHVVYGDRLHVAFDVQQIGGREGVEPGFAWNEAGWLTVRRAHPAWEFHSFTRERPQQTKDLVSLPALFQTERICIRLEPAP